MFSAIVKSWEKFTTDTALRMPSLRLPEPIIRAFSIVRLSSITVRGAVACAPSCAALPAPARTPPRFDFGCVIYRHLQPLQFLYRKHCRTSGETCGSFLRQADYLDIQRNTVFLGISTLQRRLSSARLIQSIRRYAQQQARNVGQITQIGGV